ncbi:KR domain-containing protein [Mycobacterium simiae]|uniref:KR domain-containing protein n=1 Tax=Mycobacterium simiae TaxID=1784 RepID=UPI0038CC04C9
MGHVVLVSRRGRGAGAAEVVDRLTVAGAEVSVVACDVADRGRWVSWLGLSPRYPLGCVPCRWCALMIDWFVDAGADGCGVAGQG